MTTATVKQDLTGVGYEEWLRLLFPRAVSAPFASYHHEFWVWVWSIVAGAYIRPFIAIWPRGTGKSTDAELACIAVGARKVREYGLYVSGSQAQADKHIEAIGAKLESQAIEDNYPDIGKPYVGKYGSVRGWRRNRLSTAQGFTIDALGLDTSMRGIKLEDTRPDFIILDDLDSSTDSMDVLDRKILTLTRDILPARADHCAILGVQNLIHGSSIFSRLADGRADFLRDRVVSGPYKALDNMQWEYQDGQAVITAGDPTWAYKDLAACQREVITIGIKAFLVECQQEVELAGNPRFNVAAIQEHMSRCREPLPPTALPEAWGQLRYTKGLSVWELPIPGEPYVAYTDCAEGVGKDSTASGIGRARHDGSEVLELVDNDRDPGLHAAIMVQLYHLYNNPLIGYERAKAEQFAYVLGREGYTRIYEHPREQTSIQRLAGNKPSTLRGFPMTQMSKKGLIDDFATAIETYAFQSPSRALWEQCLNYIVTADNKTEASPGNHDDRVYKAAGLVRMARQPGAQSMRTVDAFRGPAPKAVYGGGR